MKLTYQNYGSSLLMFIDDDNQDAAYARWLSFANWGATTFNEPKEIREGTLCFWTTSDKLMRYFVNYHMNLMLNEGAEKFKGQKRGVLDEAKRRAEQEISSLGYETYRSIKSVPLEHCFGTITAEKPDTDAKDFFISEGFKS